MKNTKQTIEVELGREIFNIEISDGYVDFTDEMGTRFFAKLTKTGKVKKGSVRGNNA